MPEIQPLPVEVGEVLLWLVYASKRDRLRL